jgi:hypothetical protein
VDLSNLSVREQLLAQKENGAVFPCEQYLRFSPESLMEIQGINSLFIYSKLFIAKLYIYSVTGQLHLSSFSSDLKRLAVGEKMEMKPPAPLSRNRDLKPYKLMHMHYYYHEALAFNYKNVLGKPRVKNSLNLIPACEEMSDFKPYFDDFWETLNQEIKQKGFLTGEWVIFKIHNGKKYFLDIASHGDDEYIIESAKNIYTKEFPEIFSTTI